MTLPKFLQPCLASYDLSQLDIEGDKDIIITEILNKGDYEDLEWLTKNYSYKEIKEVIAKPMRGMWMEGVLDYWLEILDLNIPKGAYKQALLNLNP
jgi:hypothetical protein